MFTHPQMNPIALSLGEIPLPFSDNSLPLDIHWYSLMYLVAFGLGWFMARWRAARPASGWRPQEVDDVVFYLILGVILGGRLGYVLFYQFEAFLQNPLMLIQLWNGGMSFHGGFIGVLVAFWYFARKSGRRFLQVSDFLAPFFPIGMGAVRFGNFVNGELWGRVTDVPWAMVYPFVDDQPRHPNQIYQILGEGVILFLIIWVYSRRPRPVGAVTGLFGLCYGIYRFVVEFFRQPDGHLGFIAFEWMTMGQLLSIPMVIIGALILWVSLHQSSRAT